MVAESGDNRPSVYREGDTWIYRASAFGDCMKALVAQRMGTATPLAFPDSAIRVMNEGHLHEGHVIYTMAENGWQIFHQQKEVQLKVGDSVIRGHIDGVFRPSPGDHTDERVGDVKAMGSDKWKQWVTKRWAAGGLNDRYQWQISIYMIALGLPGMIIAKNRDTGEIDYFEIDEPPHSLDEIVARIEAMELAAETRTLPACDPNVDKFFCRFPFLHDDVPVREVVNDEGLEILAREYDSARDAEKYAEARKKELWQELRDRLGDSDGVVTASGWTVAVTKQNRESLDKEKLEADHPGLLEKYMVSKEIEVANVRKPKEKK